MKRVRLPNLPKNNGIWKVNYTSLAKSSKNEYVIDKDESNRIANRVEAFRHVVGAKRIIHVTMVTANGLAHNVYWNNVQSEVTLDDLFRD